MRYPPELMKGLTPLLVLQAIGRRELSGLDVIRLIKERSEGGIDMPEGTIYPLLYRLERDGLVFSRWREGDGTRKTRVYALTERGRKQLAEQRKTWAGLSVAMRLVMDG
jgi:PadR family transcriptional regulator, regulatory protein PadR